jgi:hypothetical protein
MNGEPLRVSRGVVGVRLDGKSELVLEVPAEDGEGFPRQVEPLEDDRRPLLELARDPLGLGGPAEGNRPPGEVDRVVGQRELLTRLDETEARVTQAPRADEPLDVGAREQVEEAPRLRARDGERLVFPILGEEILCRDRVDTAS